MNKEKIFSVGALVVLIVAATLYGVFGMKKSDKMALDTNASANVALVNGVPITQKAFDTQLASATTTLKAQGADVTSPDKLATIKTQVLTDLINNELVGQEIVKAGIKVTSTQVDAQLQAVITQVGGADKLAAQLSAAGMTEATLRDNIAKQISIQTYLTSNIATSSVTVTDAEIKKFYDDNTKGQTGAPPLKQVSAQIKQQLITNKQQLLVNDFLVTLRAKATIVNNLK